MSARDLFYVNNIQSRVYVGREVALEKIDDDAACGRRLDILLAHRSGGIYHHNIHAVFSGFDGDLLGHELGTLVVAYHFFDGNR